LIVAEKPDWNDAKRWVLVKDVNVFAEHSRTVTDKDGKRRTVKFSKKELDETARNSNERDRVGQPCPLTLGHTDDDKPEKDQPDIVGYARNFRTAYDETLKKHVNRADFYVERDRFDEAREYKRQSVEVWANGKFFDPIAILKRTPQLDLGQWTYHKAGDIKLRYSMDELEADDDGRDTMPPPEEPEGEGDAANPSGDGQERDGEGQFDGPKDVHKAFHSDFMKCMKHHGLKSAKKFGMGDGGDLPPAKPGRSAPPAQDEPERMRRDSAELRLGRLERMLVESQKYSRDAIDSLKSENTNLKYERDAERCERMLVQLEAEGYRFEREEEVARMVGLDDAGRDKHLKYIRRNYAKAPIGGRDLTPRSDRPRLDAKSKAVTGGSESGRKRDRDEPATEAETDAAIDYMRPRGLHGEDGFEKALKAIRNGTVEE
jgi:hypothetical protein